MPDHTRLQVYQTMLQSGLVPLFYHADAATALAVTHACVKGGARVVEFTNRGPGAYDVFITLAKQRPAGCMLGVGSIYDAPTAALFLAAGADFIVSPVFNADIVTLCNRRKVAYVPGCATPSEISTAEAHGAEIVKVFPAALLGGPAFIKAVMAPSPWTRIMATGGVDATQEDITRWVAAGAACVGLGSRLVRKEWVAAGELSRITALVADVLGWITAARKAQEA